MVPIPSSSKQLPNLFLRKRRKWAHFPYKTKWHYIFNQQQALQTLKSSIFSSTQQSLILQKPTQNPTPSHLLNCLINSFASYQCEPTPVAYNFILKTLIQKSQFNEVNFVLSHILNVEKFDTPERVFVDLIRVYGENGMIKEAIDLFFKIPKFRCVPTVLSLNSLLFILCRNQECVKYVPQLLLKSCFMNIRLEKSSFSILVNALCRIGKVGFAIKLLNYMINDDAFDPDWKLYSLVLSSICRQKSVNSTELDVVCVWEDMKRVGFCPGREDFYNVIKALVRQGNGKDAFDVLCEMKREGIKPDIMCYTMVLDGLVEQGQFMRVEELFDEILIFGLVPDVITYNVYIKGLGKQTKAEDAYMIVGRMEELGCAPNLVTYNTILEAFCKIRELSRAREVWSEMQRKGIEFNCESYSLMIEGLVSGGKVEEACNVLDEMFSKRIVPASCTSDMIICTLCHKGLISEAFYRLERFSSYGVLLSPSSWEALLMKLDLYHDQVGDVLASLVNLLES